ncbi:hypothetical protein [Treponema phagedenis]|uniref:DUF4105 domain-containing protein n=1 Tax=Treponema phagedenis TaxID=162 RepID=A0AAE6M931_TREPH|nr:hypothetical protein [Treponema phagedenis]QEJ99074.1 hypothetical protein FUT82_14445 [Treponema phagedenis]QEK04585.1 hypothetical protein FUT83_12755 [Treponema phagedenis]QEK10241.1 hypothetical protein FUT81_12890 [Treponema phagedenis]
MKKLFMFSVIILSFGMVYGAENILQEDIFTGFDAQELSIDDAEIISGGETYIGYTPIMKHYYHTLTVVTDKPISDPSFTVRAVFESGVNSEGNSSASWGIGYNVQQHYNKPYMVKKNPGYYELQPVSRPAGMSVKDYDDKVIAVAEAYFKEKPKLYLVLHRNCNTTTSTIIRRSGGYVVPSKAMWRVPGWKKW